MHTRERGAAHINIFFFLVMLVLFLGALGFGYVQLTEKSAVDERITAILSRNQQLEHELLVYDHYVQDLAGVAGAAGTYDGRDGYNYELEDGVDKKTLEGVTIPGQLKSLLTDFAGQMQIPQSTATPVQSLLTQVKQTVDARDKRVTDLQGQNTTLGAQVNSMREAVSQANQQKTTEVTQLNEEKNDLRQNITTVTERLEIQIADLRAEVQRKNQELDSEREDRSTSEAAASKEKNTLRAQIGVLASKMALGSPPEQPDGSVLSASQVTRRAWVDLGRKDMLPRGTVFQITSPDGAKIKAYGRVDKLEYDRAELEVFNLADRFDPIVKGDQVRNDLYDRTLRRNIYLLGRFSYPLTKPAVKLKLQELGNTVVDAVSPGVDLVIVGSDSLNEEGDGFTPVTEMQEYKDALSLNIEITTLVKLRDFLRGASE
ncbi:MAG: hypothetical protein AAF628_36035 [Planctomycetota bacterium]